jgi:hypothetical protein
MAGRPGERRFVGRFAELLVILLSMTRLDTPMQYRQHCSHNDYRICL